MPERLILCGGARRAAPTGGSVVTLALGGNRANVTLRLEDISRRMGSNIPNVLADLVEIAAYVHCADQAVSRGGTARRMMGADWRRSFRFVVPVREPARWSEPSVMEALQSLLTFLSDDQYDFEFEQSAAPTDFQEYFVFSNSDQYLIKVDEVALFSGGLDSLSGAIGELAAGKKLALVTHRSSPKVFAYQRDLVGELKRRFPKQVIHLPALMRRHNSPPRREHTQRSRSFLYASLACAFAYMLGNSRVRFFENGVVSINLPISEQVIGARATRTTHPVVLNRFSELFGLLTQKHFEVDNPFIWRTKTEIVENILKHGNADLIRHTVSCTRPHEITRETTHCGCCSQCIDRRFAVLAAGAGEFDPTEIYRTELLAGPREKDIDRTMAESFVRTARELREANEIEFFKKFGGETARVLGCFPSLTADEVGQNVLDLHHRHGEAVRQVLCMSVASRSSDLIDHRISPSSLLAMAVAPGIAPFGQITRPPDLVQMWLNEAAAEETVPLNQAAESLQLSIDPATNEILIRDLVRIGGADGKLIHALRIVYEKDSAAKRTPDKYTYVSSDQLAADLKIEEPAVRRRVSRCRSVVKGAFVEKFQREPHKHLLIENRFRSGYRLNPRTMFVALADIESTIPRVPLASQMLRQSVTKSRHRP